ncbi:MAG TPA: hypothetical protein PKW98_19520, partial [Candidatus Wallbacteria bacterium]|nr:hypothetical protein [Candidatus Wallbacteria bacterium]
IHNPEKSVDGSESVKLTTASAGERSFYLRLQPKRDPDGEDPGFNPALYHLIVPEEGGIISVNVYLGKDKERLPEELMLEFHRVGDPEGSVNMKHRVFWGKQNIFIDGVTSTNDQRYYYMGAIPESDSEGGWCELLVPTQLLNMNNFKFDGVNIRAHSYKTSGFDVWFDRMGMLGVVPHVGENVRHSVYAWNLDDYVFYSMRVKSWDFVLNESGYAYSKYVRSKDRTPPIIEAGMPPRINYQGINDQAIKYIEPMGGVYYVHKNADDSTAEVPLVFKKPDGSYDKNKEVDLSLTTEDYLSFETIDSSRATSNKVSIGYKKLRGGESVEILLTQPTARDPLPSAEYINSEWITDISGLGMTPEEDINLNDTKNIWLVDPLKRYAGIKYYFMNNSNYIARQIVYDDEGNFALGGDTYIDVTPGPLARLSFYYPQVPVIDIKADG